MGGQRPPGRIHRVKALKRAGNGGVGLAEAVNAVDAAIGVVIAFGEDKRKANFYRLLARGSGRSRGEAVEDDVHRAVDRHDCTVVPNCAHFLRLINLFYPRHGGKAREQRRIAGEDVVVVGGFHKTSSKN